MTPQEFEAIFENQVERCREVLVRKALEYVTEDRMHNFKVAAKLQDCDPIAALSGMMAKHTVSLYDMMTGMAYPLEVWDEKITDHLNYLFLLRGLIVDKE
jgi:hypothetical protein